VQSVNSKRPEATEYAPFYGNYVSLVGEGDVIEVLTRQLDETLALMRGLSENQADSRYAPDKRSIKEVLGHVTDAERIFGYRALRFARNDRTPVSGFEQDDYMRAANFGSRPLEEIATEFEHVRRANLWLFRSLDDEAWLRRGVASDNEVSVRALAYIIAGHEAHHMQIVRTRYL